MERLSPKGHRQRAEAFYETFRASPQQERESTTSYLPNLLAQQSIRAFDPERTVVLPLPVHLPQSNERMLPNMLPQLSAHTMALLREEISRVYELNRKSKIFSSQEQPEDTITAEELKKQVYADVSLPLVLKKDKPVVMPQILDEQPDEPTPDVQVEFDFRPYGPRAMIDKRRSAKLIVKNKAKMGAKWNFDPQRDLQFRVLSETEELHITGNPKKELVPQPQPSEVVLIALMTGDGNTVSDKKYLERASLLWMYDDVLKTRYDNTELIYVTYGNIPQTVSEPVFFVTRRDEDISASRALQFIRKEIAEKYAGRDVYVAHFAYGNDDPLDIPNYCDEIDKIIAAGGNFLHAEILPQTNIYTVGDTLTYIAEHQEFLTAGKVTNKADVGPLLEQFMSELL